MKAIFLDVDGVLNCEVDFVAAPPGLQPHVIDIVKVRRLKRLVDLTKAKIVLSSTWRLSDSSRSMVLMMLWAEGMQLHEEDTPNRWGASRGAEIAEWVDRHPEVKEYVILDDDSDMTDEQKRDHFVHTSFKDGLTDAHVDKAINLLCQDDAQCAFGYKCSCSPQGKPHRDSCKGWFPGYPHYEGLK